MKKGFKLFDKIILEVNKFMIVIMLALMFILLFINVIGRYFFKHTLLGADELSRYLMISIAFLGLGYGMREGKHSSFTFLQDSVSNKTRKFIRAVVAGLIYFLILSLFYYGYKYMIMYMNNSTQVLQWKLGWWYMFIPLGAILFVYHFTIVVKDYINEAKHEDIEREIRSGEELIQDSKYASLIDSKEED